MEGDFNATNKIVYGVQMMSNAWGHHLMPEEIFSEKNWMADDGMFSLGEEKLAAPWLQHLM